MTSGPAGGAMVDRVVLVTGGTSGTGLRSAERFLRAGARVVVNGRSEQRGLDALRSLQELSPHVRLHLGDCSDYDAAAGAVRTAVEAFGGIDVLVSAGASGVGDPTPFADQSPTEIRDALMLRYLARMYPAHAAIAQLRTRPGAAMVLLTTDAARHATPGESVIGSYAAGVVAATKTLARELARDDIRVNAVSMTLTSETRSWEQIFGAESYQKDLFARAVERFPMGAPSADEVADAVFFLGSPAAAKVTGQTLSVNGGLSFGGW